MQNPVQPTFATPCSDFSQATAASISRAARSRSIDIASLRASSGSVDSSPWYMSGAKARKPSAA